MTIETFPGLEGLRIDRDLESFDKLLEFFLKATERIKSGGKKAVAVGPLTPCEMIYAAGGLPYDILTRANLSMSILEGRTCLINEAVEAGMSPELSPWQLVMLGLFLSNQKKVPVDMFASAVGGYDDQLTKSFQVMARTKALPLRFFEIPRYESASESWALHYLEKELSQFIEWLELGTAVKVTDKSLRAAIADTNLVRKDVIELSTLLSAPRVPLGALEYYLVQMMVGDFGGDPAAMHGLFQVLLAELQGRIDSGYSVPGITSPPVRIFLMGDETQELSLFNAIENYGGSLVGCDFRLPLYYDLIEEKRPSITSFASWVYRMPNNMPTAKRIKVEIDTIKRQKPDAVIINGIVGSRSMPGTERMVRDVLKEELGVPVLCLETTLPHENAEKVDYQIRAFMEMMR